MDHETLYLALTVCMTVICTAYESRNFRLTNEESDAAKRDC